jgi:hypothetical protein
MKRDFFSQPQYPCRFGPGGDFLSVWPLKELPPRPANSLAALLDTIGEIVNAVIGSEYDGRGPVPRLSAIAINSIVFPKEKVKHVSAKTPDRPADAQANADTPDRRPLTAQSMLFADNSGNRQSPGNKQKHNLRAYRRAAKKRTPCPLPDQGSLFEADVQSAKTA